MLRISLCCLPLALGCSNHGPPGGDAFDTFEACWTEHHVTEAFDVQQAIVICCIDHPIGGVAMNMVCGATAQTCTTYVTASLMPTDASSTDISTACTTYITQRGM